MIFCNKCSNICHLNDNMELKKLQYVCVECSFKEDITNYCILQKKYNIQKENLSLNHMINFKDPTFPTNTNMKCYNCNNTNIKYIRNNNLSIQHFCVDCNILL